MSVLERKSIDLRRAQRHIVGAYSEIFLFFAFSKIYMYLPPLIDTQTMDPRMAISPSPTAHMAADTLMAVMHQNHAHQSTGLPPPFPTDPISSMFAFNQQWTGPFPLSADTTSSQTSEDKKQRMPKTVRKKEWLDSLNKVRFDACFFVNDGKVAVDWIEYNDAMIRRSFALELEIQELRRNAAAFRPRNQ
jgi:hypothetical protein